MAYELTESGKKCLETSSKKLDAIWSLPPGDKSRQTAAFDRLTKRQFLLDKISKGEGSPVSTAFDYLEPGYRRTRGEAALKKELASMLKANLVREVPSEESEVTITEPGGRVLPAGEADAFVQKLQRGTSYLPQSRRRRGMF